MPYCSQNDILGSMDEEDLIRYTDDFDTGIPNAEAVAKAIAGADALINAHIASRYLTPLSPVPDIVNSLAVDIAIYKISSRRGGAPEENRIKYDDAVKFLEKVSTGKVILAQAVSAPSSVSDDGVKITSDPRIFTRDDMGGF